MDSETSQATDMEALPNSELRKLRTPASRAVLARRRQANANAMAERWAAGHNA
jgi:hypothetical protein